MERVRSAGARAGALRREPGRADRSDREKRGQAGEHRPRLRLAQILRSCTHLCTAKDKALVGTIPTYE